MQKSRKFREKSNKRCFKALAFFYQFCEQCDLTSETSIVSMLLTLQCKSWKLEFSTYLLTTLQPCYVVNKNVSRICFQLGCKKASHPKHYQRENLICMCAGMRIIMKFERLHEWCSLNDLSSFLVSFFFFLIKWYHFPGQGQDMVITEIHRSRVVAFSS